MLVEDVMADEMVTCDLNESLENIAYKMWNGDLGAVPVLNEYGMPVGMITDRDICMALALRHSHAAHLHARDLLHGRFVSCSPKWEIKQALKLMAQEKIRRLPVVNGDGHIMGLVSLGDLAVVAVSGKKKTELTKEEFVDAFNNIATPHIRHSHELAVSGSA